MDLPLTLHHFFCLTEVHWMLLMLSRVVNVGEMWRKVRHGSGFLNVLTHISKRGPDLPSPSAPIPMGGGEGGLNILSNTNLCLHSVLLVISPLTVWCHEHLHSTDEVCFLMIWDVLMHSEGVCESYASNVPWGFRWITQTASIFPSAGSCDQPPPMGTWLGKLHSPQSQATGKRGPKLKIVRNDIHPHILFYK